MNDAVPDRLDGGLAQEQRPAIAGESTGGEIGHHFALTKILKLERSLITVWRRLGIGFCGSLMFHTNNLSRDHIRSSPRV